MLFDLDQQCAIKRNNSFMFLLLILMKKKNTKFSSRVKMFQRSFNKLNNEDPM